MHSRYFRPIEVFHPSFIASTNQDAVFSRRPQAIWDALDRLREAWGKPIYINHRGLRYCGVRPLDSPVGAKASAHKPLYDDRQAFDLHGRTKDETRDLYSWIIAEGWKVGNVVRLEDWKHTPTWCHAEISVNTPTNPPKVFIP